MKTHIFYIFILCYCLDSSFGKFNLLKYVPTRLEIKYGPFSTELREKMLQETKEMFYFGYNNYMQYAFPMDELNPILCKGRGPDYENP